MKKRIISLAFSAMLIISCCLSVGAEAETNNTVESTAEVLGATYYDYTVYGPVADNEADVHVIEFNPADGLIPLAYAANAGDVDLAADHIAAAEAEGYTVVGAINGSFFEMATGNPCGTLISDGKLVFTHSGLSGEAVATFDYEGKCRVVSSSLQFTFKLAGKNVPAGIGLVNKKYSACSLAKTTDITGKFHYYDIDACELADEAVTGYEIICEKLDGTELAVNETLSAKVLEIKSDSYYGATDIIEENKFVLFLRNDSKFIEKAEGLSVGDELTITPKEGGGITSSEAMNNAVSAISSSYWLVQDGTDLTDTTATIIHSTSLARAWTVFGVKEDGSYVFWASEEVTADGEKALTLKDVADAMVAMGCTDVIRLDGGGSTSIYINGIGSPITTTRAVCDMLLIVEKSDLKTKAPETDEPEEISDGSITEESVSVPSEDDSSAESESQAAENNGDGSENSSGLSSTYIILIACAAVAVLIGIVLFVLMLRKR